MKALLVSHFMPDKVGQGRNHRSYQIRYDIESIFGHENVLTFYFLQWRDSQPSQNSLSPFQNIDACVNSLRCSGRHNSSAKPPAGPGRVEKAMLKYL